MDFEISGMTDARMQSWAKKCDANGDGKIDDNEVSIFNQGKENMHEVSVFKRTTVGGVTFNLDTVQTIQKNKNGDKFDYSVRFANGMKMQFDEQNEGNDASAFYSPDNPNGKQKILNTFFVSHITDGDGFSVKGTRLADYFHIHNSMIDKVDGLAGEDEVHISSSMGNKNSGQIFAERGLVADSSGLSIKTSSQKFLRHPFETSAINVSDKHPYEKWGK